MIPRLILVLLVLFSFPALAHAYPSPEWGGPGIRWKGPRVDVGDYMEEDFARFTPYLLESWDQAITPVNFVYHRKQVRSCRWVREHAPEPITLCNQGIAGAVGQARQLYHPTKRGRIFERVRIVIDHTEQFHDDRGMRLAVCHELGHALTGMMDNYDFTDPSCVRGNADEPTEWDLGFAERVYTGR